VLSKKDIEIVRFYVYARIFGPSIYLISIISRISVDLSVAVSTFYKFLYVINTESGTIA